MGESRRSTRSIVGAALCAAGLLALAGCSSAAPRPSPTPTPSPSGTAALLAEAIDAYVPFSAAFDLFLSGEEPGVAFDGLVTDEFLDSIAADLAAHPRTTLTTGSSSFSDAKLVSVDSTGPEVDIALAVCRDVSRTTIVDAATGHEATPADRRLRIPLLVSLVDRDGHLLIAEVTQWNEESYCL